MKVIENTDENLPGMQIENPGQEHQITETVKEAVDIIEVEIETEIIIGLEANVQEVVRDGSDAQKTENHEIETGHIVMMIETVIGMTRRGKVEHGCKNPYNSLLMSFKILTVNVVRMERSLALVGRRLLDIKANLPTTLS